MLLVVGQIGKPHGIRGEVLVTVRTDDPEARFTAGSAFTTEVPRDRRVSAGPAVAAPGVPYQVPAKLVLEAIRWHQGKGIVDHPDDVRVRLVDSRRGKRLEVRVHPEDLGTVIGRGGRTAKALRQVIGSIGGRGIRVDIVDAY